jgi:BirA family transcriptional regulator, biotin operon repressor / biotin---[acetyl-CoA-carboxylase] ligase
VTWLGSERVALDTCGSTNDVALVHARAGAAHGTIITADTQTAGRGRLGRVWASPPESNLYMSIIVRAPRPLAELAPLTLAIGIGVVDAVRDEGAAAAALKWPNDVLAAGKKLAGILCEVAGDGCVVAGIGVNVNGVPPEVAARATSIAGERGAPVDRAGFTERLLATLEPWIDRFLAGGVPAIAAAWEQRMDASLTLRSGGAIGTALGLDRDGALRLRDASGVIHRIHAGDVDLCYDE